MNEPTTNTELNSNELTPLSKEDRVDFWTRLGAYLIDFLFIIILGLAIGLTIGDLLAPVLFGGQMADMNVQMDQMSQLSPEVERMLPNFMGLMMKMMAFGAGTSIAGLILLVMEASVGQSVGKMLLKIRISNVYGYPATPKELWSRALFKYGSTVLSLLGGITGLMILSTLGSILGLVVFVGFFLVFMDNRQTIHDMVAKTIVARK